MNADVTVAAVELGGTKVLVTTGRGPADHTAIVRLATGAPATTLPAVVRALEAAEAATGPLAAIGVASFGPLQLDPASPDYGRLLATPKPGWTGADLIGALRARFDVPIALETDVNAAALGEGRWGPARGADTYAYVTVGTGVGVGVVVAGRPLHGAGHPEGGHMRLRPRPGDAFPGVCPWHGRCVEGMISGPALQARLGRPGADAAADDPVWAAAGEDLAQLCAALVLLLAPQCIVVGGGVGARPELLAAARRALPAELNGYLARVDGPEAIARLLVPAALPQAGLMGALHLAAGLARP